MDRPTLRFASGYPGAPIRSIAAFLILAMATLAGGAPAQAQASRSPAAAEIDRKVDAGLEHLYAQTPAARTLANKAKAILVFPDVAKGGLIVGGQYGKGALRKGGRTVAYYETLSASYGLQAGVQ